VCCLPYWPLLHLFVRVRLQWSDHVPVVLKLRRATGSGPCPASVLSSRNTIRDGSSDDDCDDSDVDGDGDVDDSDKDGDTGGATTDGDDDDDEPLSQDARKRPRVV
jgi:hypothetical protein